MVSLVAVGVRGSHFQRRSMRSLLRNIPFEMRHPTDEAHIGTGHSSLHSWATLVAMRLLAVALLCGAVTSASAEFALNTIRLRARVGGVGDLLVPVPLDATVADMQADVAR